MDFLSIPDYSAALFENCDRRGKMTVRITDYPDNGNASARWNAAFRDARKCGDNEIFFPHGTYHFHQDGTAEKYCFFSNNDEGVKQIVFDLDSLDGFTVSGDDALFVFHGRLTPFRLLNCSNITLRGFRIDFAESMVSDAEILRVASDATELKLHGTHWMEGGRLHFIRDAYDNFSNTLAFLQFDPLRKEPLQKPIRFSCPNRILPSPDGTVRLPLAFGQPGDCFAIKHQGRFNPAIVIDRSENTTVKDVTVHHCGGMALLAQCSTNLVISGLSVIPAANRMISVPDDCIHCADCRGEILIDSCRLENSLDDAINVHGISRRLRTRTVGERFLFLETGHFQQFGLEAARPGDELEFIKNDTLRPYHKARLKSVCPLNKQITGVEFEGELPAEYTDGDCVRNLAAASAVLTVRNCRIRATRPRGILCSGLGRILIENNFIHTPGAGVYISGDANFWFESGPLSDVLIRGNHFEHCCFLHGSTGRAAISILPEIPRELPDFYFHRNIRIRENTFIGNTSNAVIAHSVNGLDFTQNTVQIDSAYTSDNPYRDPVQASHCKNITVR